MKISIVGAGGGIGQRLVPAFASRHQVIPIYRSRKAQALDDAPPVLFGDRTALAEAVAGSEIVIHAALNKRAKGDTFIPENKAITETLLSLADRSVCRLFVYFSSQVVYSGQAPKNGAYAETQPLAPTEPIDAYSRLKIEEEARVIAFCAEAGIPYLIVRPTVVMGPGMDWSSGIVQAMRWAPVGVKGRIMNLVHVDDLAADLLALIEGGKRNEIYNLGDFDVTTEDYFRCAAEAAKRKVKLLPDAVSGALGKLLPSTLWFLRSDVRIDCSRIKAVSPRKEARALRDYFPIERWSVEAADLETIAGTLRRGEPFEVNGRGYSRWFGRSRDANRLSLAGYRGIVGLDGDLVTVKAGTPLFDVLDFLDGYGLTLGTLPDFRDISAGACFFTEVHGSSQDYVSMYDLIERIGYVDERGEEIIVSRDAGGWDAIRGTPGVVVTQISFRCVPVRQLSNRIEWHDQQELDALVASALRPGPALTLHWYPVAGKVLVCSVAPPGASEATDRTPFTLFRGFPYKMLRLLLAFRMRGKLRVVGKSHEIQASWRAMPFPRLVNAYFLRLKSPIQNMEVCVPAGHAVVFVRRLQEAIANGQVVPGRQQGIGLRFTRDPTSGRAYAWVETTSSYVEQLMQIVRLAREVCGSDFWLHRGKYVPAGIGPEALFIRRHVPAETEPS